jgi:hypothetical protein
MGFVFATEDALDIPIPEEKLDPREETNTLEQVCVIIDEIRVSKQHRHESHTCSDFGFGLNLNHMMSNSFAFG